MRIPNSSAFPRRARGGVLIFALALLVTSAPSEENAGLRFRSDSGLVLVPVTVTNRRGGAIVDLRQDEFALFADSRSQPIAAFYREAEPAAVGIVLDISGSVEARIAHEKQALRLFLSQAEDRDEFFLATVSSAPALEAGFVDAARLLDRSRLVTSSGGATALYDAISLALDHLRSSSLSRRVLLVISDGIDNHSRHTKSELLHRLEEASVQVHTLAIAQLCPLPKGVELTEILRGASALEDLASRTGGLSRIASSNQNPMTAAIQIADAIHNQYVIAFRNEALTGDNKWHRIDVRVSRRNATVSSRRGYRAP